jgi:uncharacterized protein YjbI with pentapeptide repeats
VVLGFAAAAALAAFALKWAPEWLATGGLKGKERAEELGRTRTAVLATLAGLIALAGAVFTGLSYRLNRSGQITERFTRAIDQLGSRELDVRLGGIYALERIARDSKDDQPQVMEVLTAYVREHAPWPPKSSSPTSDSTSDSISHERAGTVEAILALERIAKGAQPESAPSATRATGQPGSSEGESQPSPLPTDVQAALSVLGRRKVSHDGPEAGDLDLARTDLRRAQLADANLQGANLRDANLQRAWLARAKLQGANLSDVNLLAAHLIGANLEHALLVGADLELATLIGANLKRAGLFRANLQRAGLTRANLEGADLDGANLEGATLGQANLHGAGLIGANLQDALYNAATRWPEGFKPEDHGARRLEGKAG